MRSASSSVDAPSSSAEGLSPDDLTMRARIRDAAIVRFPIDGFQGTTVRTISGDVGASPGLVLHHFGSKAGLRDECDEYVIRKLFDAKRTAGQEGSYRDAGAIASAYTLAEPLLRYVAWTLTDGGKASARFFDHFLEEVERQLEDGQEAGIVNQLDDIHAQAAVLAVMQLGGLVLHDHLSRAMGVDTLSAEGLIATAPHALRLFSGTLFNQEALADATKAVGELQDNERQQGS